MSTGRVKTLRARGALALACGLNQSLKLTAARWRFFLRSAAPPGGSAAAA